VVEVKGPTRKAGVGKELRQRLIKLPRPSGDVVKSSITQCPVSFNHVTQRHERAAESILQHHVFVGGNFCYLDRVVDVGDHRQPTWSNEIYFALSSVTLRHNGEAEPAIAGVLPRG